MIRTVVVPQQQDISIHVPEDFLGKRVEVIAFTIEEAPIDADKQLPNNKEKTILGIPVDFHKNNYINSINEFWKIQSLFKKDEILNMLQTFNGVVSDESIEYIFNNKPSLQFFIDSNGKNIFAYSSPAFIKKHGTLFPVNALATLKKYGIDKLEQASEKGYTKL